jgi:catechol 2,3-dioxygenase-like lactoylglutathione lyase family enzyme
VKLKQVNHVGIRTKDREKLERFYVEVLGLVPHPEKRNWLKVGDSNTLIHLMPVNGSAEGNDMSDYARHVCLEAESLEEVVTTMLARGIKPFQCEIDATKRRELADASDLTFGIGTVFITDPEGNVIEFMQADRGVFARYRS